MTTRHVLPALLCLALVAAAPTTQPPGSSQPALPPGVEAARRQYLQSIDKAREQFDQAQLQAKAAYLKQLDAVIAAESAKGNQQGGRAAQMEKMIVENPQVELSFERQRLTFEEMRTAETLRKFDEEMKTGGSLDIDMALQRDVRYSQLRHEVDELELATADAETSAGSKNPRVVALHGRLDSLGKRFHDYEATAREEFATRIRAELQKKHADAAAALKAFNKRVQDERDAKDKKE